jgi:flagellar protein FliS
MDHSAQQYLHAQVMSATPQKLRLMLIEGAIRFARQALSSWEQNHNEQATDWLTRCRNIISELLASIRLDQSSLTRSVAGVYLFLFRSLTEGQLQKDRRKIEEAISVLEIERETWRMVCDKLPDAPFPMDQSGAVRNATEIIAPTSGIDGPPQSGFVVDA